MALGAVKIIDATLREGAQTPGVSFSLEQSRRIAMALDALGVDMIECGHPAVDEAERWRVMEVVQAVRAPVLSHARADPRDVRAVASTGAAWVGIFIGVNEISRRTRLSDRVGGDLPSSIASAVAEAKALGLSVRFTVEDASRTPPDELAEAFASAVTAGADRLCYADTVGVLTPLRTTRAVAMLRTALPDTPLELHLHDDRGLALACAMAGAEAGADWIATTVNGIGERCGIVDTLQLLVNLRLEGVARTFPDGLAVAGARDIVAAITGLPVPPQHACTGAWAFTHTARLHTRAVARDPGAYEAIDPAWTAGRTAAAS